LGEEAEGYRSILWEETLVGYCKSIRPGKYNAKFLMLRLGSFSLFEAASTEERVRIYHHECCEGRARNLFKEVEPENDHR